MLLHNPEPTKECVVLSGSGGAVALQARNAAVEHGHDGKWVAPSQRARSIIVIPIYGRARLVLRATC